jgi:hypothetical protein
VNRNESPIGRLKRACDYWQSIKANDHVLGIIKDGYKIPFLTEPEECILKNNKFNLFLFSATVKGLTTFGNTCTSVIHPIWFSVEISDSTNSE